MTRFPFRRIHLAAGLGVATVLVAAALADGNSNGTPSAASAAHAPAVTAPPAMQLIPADIVTVGEGPVGSGVRLTGTLDPLNRASINARVAAVVDSVAVREGESVRKGQVLLKQVIIDASAQLRQAEAQLASAKVELQLTEAYEQRKKALHDQKYLSDVDFAAAQGETEVKRGMVKIQEANVAIARRALADTALASPIDGIVANRYVEPGSNVMPGQALLTLVDLSRLELAADIPARDATRVKIGDDVAFTAEGLGDRVFHGRIARINPMAGSSRTLRVYALVDNRDGALRGGLFASGSVVAAHDASKGKAATLRLPASAVRLVDGKTQVWVLRNDALALQPVVLGKRDAASGQVEVKSGVKAGERVVLTDLGKAAVAGTRVTVAQAN